MRLNIILIKQKTKMKQIFLILVALLLTNCSTTQGKKFIVYEGMSESQVKSQNGMPFTILSTAGFKGVGETKKGLVYKNYGFNGSSEKFIYVVLKRGKVVGWTYQNHSDHTSHLFGY